MVLKVIFDTNVWCHLLKERITKIKKLLAGSSKIEVYRYSKIEDELKAIPKHAKLGKFSKRKVVIELYNFVTKGNYLRHSLEINKLAKKYYNYYKQHGGGHDWRTTNISVDFSIVACASKWKMDVVYSEDKNSLASKIALKAYKHVNIKEGHRTPNFLKLNDLKTTMGF